MEYKPNSKAAERLLKRARSRLQLACSDLVDYIKTSKLSKGRRGLGDFLGAGDAPYSWSGSLSDSVQQRWKAGDPNTQQVGSPLLHARVQERGAKIHGSKGMLTIPRTDEAIRHLKGGGTARTFPRPLTVIPSRGRPGIFFLVEQRRGGKKNLKRTEIHFVLARNVTIPPHPWLLPSLREFGQQMMKVMGG